QTGRGRRGRRAAPGHGGGQAVHRPEEGHSQVLIVGGGWWVVAGAEGSNALLHQPPPTSHHPPLQVLKGVSPMNRLLLFRGLAFAAGVLLVVVALAAAAPPESLAVGLAALGAGAGLLALANAPAYITRRPGSAWALDRTAFFCSCVFLAAPLVVLFLVSLLGR